MNRMANVSGMSGSGGMTGMSGMNRMDGMGRGEMILVPNILSIFETHNEYCG